MSPRHDMSPRHWPSGRRRPRLHTHAHTRARAHTHTPCEAYTANAAQIFRYALIRGKRSPRPTPDLSMHVWPPNPRPLDACVAAQPPTSRCMCGYGSCDRHTPITFPVFFLAFPLPIIQAPVQRFDLSTACVCSY